MRLPRSYPLALATSLLPDVGLAATQSLPLVIWHGLGDNFANPSLLSIGELYNDTFPDSPAYTHVIGVGTTASSDRNAGFFGNLTTQLTDVCAQLRTHPILGTAPAINAIGLSQGGLFLRAYVERCNDPPVRNLLTFGSPHNGIAEFQACNGPTDFVCQSVRSVLRSNTWSSFAQNGVVPAQYFRDASTPDGLHDYLEYSNFLADINNERPAKNHAYRTNLASLQKFVTYMFDEDKTIVPKQSSQWAEVNITSGDITELRKRNCYLEDWVGLRTLDERGSLLSRTLPGPHMNISDESLVDAFKKYLAPDGIDHPLAEAPLEL